MHTDFATTISKFLSMASLNLAKFPALFQVLSLCALVLSSVAVRRTAHKNQEPWKNKPSAVSVLLRRLFCFFLLK